MRELVELVRQEEEEEDEQSDIELCAAEDTSAEQSHSVAEEASMSQDVPILQSEPQHDATFVPPPPVPAEPPEVDPSCGFVEDLDTLLDSCIQAHVENAVANGGYSLCDDRFL